MHKQTLDDLIHLTGLSEEDYNLLREHRDTTLGWADEMVKAFYDTLFAYPPTAEVFGEDEHAAREETLRDWYLEVCRGEISEDFWRRQWLVGLVHIARHVNTPFMCGMISRLQQLFLQKCLSHYQAAQAEQLYGAFKRLTDVIGGLIAESYFRNYIEAMENVGGLKLDLVQRMIDLEISKKFEKLKQT